MPFKDEDEMCDLWLFKHNVSFKTPSLLHIKGYFPFLRPILAPAFSFE